MIPYYFFVEKEDVELKLSIALKPKNGDLLEKSLIEIATPGSARFRKYLSKAEITNIVGRSDDEINRVSKFFEEKGAKVISVPPHRDWVVISAPVSAVEKMFACRLHAFVSPETQRIRIGAADSYSVPSEISDLVDLVAGMKVFDAKCTNTPRFNTLGLCVWYLSIAISKSALPL